MGYMAAGEATRGRVLVVEDDESTALFVTRVLSRNGFDAAWVMDAEQAAHRLGSEPFDVLLADYRLPGQSGLELARDTRRTQPRMGIAVMTSFVEGGTEELARASGADDFFEKPLHFSNLVTRIRDLVTRSRASRIEVSTSQSPSGASQASPTAQVREVSPPGGAAGPPYVAESGSDEQAVPRDAGSALPDIASAGDASHPQPEGFDAVDRARSSAQSNSVGVHDSRCEGSCDATPRGEVGRLDSDLLARASHPSSPASDYVMVRRVLAQRLIQPVIMWASGAPAISIGSCVGRVTAVRTRPDWSVAG
jgi:CheY-like chemotaxis protein